MYITWFEISGVGHRSEKRWLAPYSEWQQCKEPGAPVSTNEAYLGFQQPFTAVAMTERLDNLSQLSRVPARARSLKVPYGI
jgi:hypothetical protein